MNCSYDLTKMALAFGMLAFQLHILTMTVCKFFLVYPTHYKDHSNHRNNVILAFIIIAYVLYIFSVLLLLALSYTRLKGNRLMSVFAAAFLFVAASCVVVGLAVFDATVTSDDPKNYDYGRLNSYTTTTFATSAASGYVAGVVILVSICV